MELGDRRVRCRPWYYLLQAWFSYGFLDFPFLTYLVISNTLVRLWKIGAGIHVLLSANPRGGCI